MITFVKSSLLILAILACSWQAPPAPRGRAGAEGEESAQTAELFRDKCARCHGEDGRGQTVIGRMVSAPDFADERWWDEEKDEHRFARSIAEGKGEMPAFARKLTRPEVRALAAYVKTFRKSAR